MSEWTWEDSFAESLDLLERQAAAIGDTDSLALVYKARIAHHQVVASFTQPSAADGAPDPRCAASASPGQGQTVRCFLAVGHDGRHRAYDLSWIDGADDDMRLEDWCPINAR